MSRLCNRCGGTYRRHSSQSGVFDLDFGPVEISADLCGDCYGDILDAYREGEA